MLETTAGGGERRQQSLNWSPVTGTQILHDLFFISMPGKSVREKKNTRGPFKHPRYSTEIRFDPPPWLEGEHITSQLADFSLLQPLLPSGPWPQPFSPSGAAQAPGHTSPPGDFVPVAPELCCPIRQPLVHVAREHRQRANLWRHQMDFKGCAKKNVKDLVDNLIYWWHAQVMFQVHWVK